MHPAVFSPFCGSRRFGRRGGLYFPGTRGAKRLVSQNNSGFKGSIKNPPPEKSPPQGVKRRRHYYLGDDKTFITSSTNVQAVPHYLVFKRREDGFSNLSSFLRKRYHRLRWISRTGY